MTINEEKIRLRALLHEGGICRCCNQRVQMYSRKITSAMAIGLTLIYNESTASNKEWIHIENFLKGIDAPASLRGDIPKLRFWNLIQPKEGEKTDGNPNNGYYKITDIGKLFAENKLKVQSHVNIYNNKMYGYSKESKEITIIEALGKKFNYNELINHIPHGSDI